jgi:energy-coupling factor transporter ATP-binding protein EcfA2
MSSSRLDRIEICDFRGFPAELVPPLRLSGKNLLLYGENGSGKSTVFQALAQLLDLNHKQPFDGNLKDARCLKHRFTDPTLTVGRVTLHFTSSTTGPAHPEMTWRIGASRPLDHPFFRSMARTRGFLDYRSVLQTHFLERDRDGINLFPLVVEYLLQDVEFPTTRTTFGEQWEAIQDEGRKWLELAARDLSEMDDAEKLLYGLEPPETEDGEENVEFDEVAAFQEYVASQRELLVNRIQQFNDALLQRVTEIQTLANRFIAGFEPLLEIDFGFAERVKSPDPASNLPWPGEPKLLLRANFRNQLIEHPGTFLNEARLTAIALAFYLGALKVEIPESASLTSSEPRLLVLDDVLIGLDMAHRLPVLALVEAEFVEKGWQVMLFTFDRAWYEVAKQRLGGERWKRYELFASPLGDYDKPILLPDDEHLYRALTFLLQGEVKAAAVHVRTKFELILKGACEELGVAVKYRSRAEKVPASDFWAALKAVTVKTCPSPVWIDNHRWWQPPPEKVRVVPVELERQIEHAVSWVLNPLSHSEFVDRYRTEIEEAIFAVNELEQAVQRASSLARATPHSLMRMLVAVLKSHVQTTPPVTAKGSTT